MSCTVLFLQLPRLNAVTKGTKVTFYQNIFNAHDISEKKGITLSSANVSLAKRLPFVCCFCPAFGVGAQPQQRGHGGYRPSQLPGQRPRGLRGWSEEVHRVLHVSAVLHHSRRRPPQRGAADTHSRGQ